MSRLATIRPEFVEFVPKELDDGVLYICMPYRTTVHKCACGCGSKVTLPISPTKWRFLWDGDTISMWPSIGNWSYPCQSHYWIDQDSIVWAPKMTRAEIDAGRARDNAEHQSYLMSRGRGGEVTASFARRGLIDRLLGFIRR